MNKCTLVVITTMVLSIGALSASGAAAAQAIKLHEQTKAQGKTVRTPYVTHAEFKAVYVSGKKITGKSSEKK